MNRFSRLVLGLLPLVVAALATPLAACRAAVPSSGLRAAAMAPAGQGDALPARKKGTICKEEVDALIGLVRSTAREQGLAALGGDSVLATAQILCAMGHCHRRYHASDGPVVRPSLGFLIKHRRADGSFGDAATTAWVIEALTVLDSDGYVDEVAQARAWLRAQGAAETAPSFRRAVAGVLEQVRVDVFPQHLASGAADRGRAMGAERATLDRGAAAQALLELVACQVANKQLDRTQDAPAASFSPAQQKAFAWLLGQQKDGVVSMRGRADAALTGFVLLALQTKPKAQRSADEQAAIEKGVRWLLTQQRDDGTWGEQVPNYTTCVVTGALAKWDDKAAVQAAMAKAQRAILGFQNAESGGYTRSDRDYGSIGYGSSQRGDLSNLHFSLQALRETGLPENHEAFAKALVFLQRTQNLKSHNDFSGKVPDPDREGVILDATSGDDGGAAYYPGNSAAGYLVLPDGKAVPRSYGSMTYALLKSYTLAGLKGDDPRVQAAVRWIQDNWTLAVNPGADPALGEKVQYQGLFYYYMVLGQALDLAGAKTIKAAAKNAKGEAVTEDVDWRQALRAHLEGMQKPDGTWVNAKNDRWMEGLPLLCTCYAMAALEHCK